MTFKDIAKNVEMYHAMLSRLFEQGAEDPESAAHAQLVELLALKVCNRDPRQCHAIKAATGPDAGHKPLLCPWPPSSLDAADASQDCGAVECHLGQLLDEELQGDACVWRALQQLQITDGTPSWHALAVVCSMALESDV